MGSWIRRIIAVLFWIALAFDLAAWGGVAQTPSVGPAVLASARKEAPLALTWMQAGRVLVSPFGLEAWSRGFAEAQFGTGYEAVRARPAVAMEALLAEARWTMRAAHPAPPVLLAAWGLLWWLRPKQVETIRRRR